MRFRLRMVNDLGNCHEETLFANNEKETKSNVQTFISKSKVLEANGSINRMQST